MTFYWITTVKKVELLIKIFYFNNNKNKNIINHFIIYYSFINNSKFK